jgi:hypothetical protein
VPRARIKIDAGGSPEDATWESDPEGTIRRIAEEEGATYIEESLIWTNNGKCAEALIKTTEATKGEPGTNFLELARRLDVAELCLYIDTETHFKRRG